jgi:Beta-ketoacyl synthase, C-terminal domain
VLVGSLKTNVGHLESTSGIASVIKVVLALENGVIPPSLNFDTPNSAIDLIGWNLEVSKFLVTTFSATDLTTLGPYNNETMASRSSTPSIYQQFWLWWSQRACYPRCIFSLRARAAPHYTTTCRQ